MRDEGEINIKIDRSINTNGSVRFYGGDEWGEFIQSHFNLYDKIYFEIINRNTIRIQ